MFQTDFFRDTVRTPQLEFTSKVSASEIEYACLTRWEEHCVECSAPSCYDSCALYSKRADLMCARFASGIVPNSTFRGPLGYGADITFKRWGKLEAQLQYGPLSLPSYLRLVQFDEAVLKFVRPMAALSNSVLPVRKMNPHIIHNYLRNRLLRRYRERLAGAGSIYDAFLVEGFNPGSKTVQLNLEIRQKGTVKHRSSLSFAPGPNLHRLPYASLNVDFTRSPQDGDLFAIYPDNDEELRIIFTWLNFVKFAAAPASVAANDDTLLRQAAVVRPADKVKCVIWDLDDTIWNGVLIEDGPDRLRLRENVAETIAELDRRGFLQSIVSKNDHDFAWPCVKQFELDKFFLHPQINWRPKSENIQRIATELNLNVDSFALIDDSAFERGEVRETLPQMRLYSETQVDALLGLPEFEVPVTAESAKRREMYLQENARRQVAEAFTVDYERFLRGCDLQVAILSPSTEAQIVRCYELVQRTNQLNSSGNRYSQGQFRDLIRQPDMLPVTVSCEDRFGNYGLVGYLSVRLPNSSRAVVEDFVLSCRVAEKRVEHAVFKALAGWLSQHGFTQMSVNFVATQRNGIMKKVFDEIGFSLTAETESESGLTVSVSHAIPWSDIVLVKQMELDSEKLPLVT